MTKALLTLAVLACSACSSEPPTSARPIDWDAWQFPDAGSPAPPLVQWTCVCPPPGNGDLYTVMRMSPWDPCDAERWRDVVLKTVCPPDYWTAPCQCSCGNDEEPQSEQDADALAQRCE